MPDIAVSHVMGILFDLIVLYEDEIDQVSGFRRNFSWTTSRDGFALDQALRFSMAGGPNHVWEMGINRR